ncbi:PREDICTED: pentatricopeptide repeat-containing protein At4g21705, mitochondrial-like [Tarenaya hassleriana]|uniref:pentatricopeptide repeat-containing protein At4g21705, mitochondrial-like n=1 Tax=Tarenaya hassleriana TaxID=28532 RepID=UPI00053C0EB5|nr:PREDICTED: pentatricopeptide repeat-containing protein At4g21705, mitochondrial-like [Tarenaya hassleriana]
MNTVRKLSTILMQRAVINRFYYTNRVKTVTLYSRISLLGNPKASILPELQSWVQSGKKVSVAELIRIVHDLRRRKRFNHALQVSKWMNDTGVCVFSPTEHAVHLDLIGRVHGFVTAEEYFNRLNEQYKTEKTYGALLNCYVRQQDIDKSLFHFQRMKEMGITLSSLTYNNIMCLYTKTSQHDKVPTVLNEMKLDNVAPDNYSFRICINAYGVMSDLEGIERTLREMENHHGIIMDWNTYAVAAHFYIKAGNADRASELLKKSEERLENKDGTGYNHLISLYASRGEKTEVLRLWDLEKEACKRHINQDYIVMLQSLVKLDGLEEAEKVLEEWESSGNCYDFRVPRILIRGYAAKGLSDKAEEVLEDLSGKGKATTPDSWGILADNYAEKGELDKAFRCMKSALSVQGKNRKWRPGSKLVTSVLSWLGVEGNFKEVESFVESLKTSIGVNREMYSALIRADVREGGKNTDTLLKRMEEDKVDADEETMRILSTRRLS